MTPPPTITILHRDDDLVVVSKPAGMLVHRDAMSRTFEHLLLNTVRDQVGAHLYPIHRLDRNTSGIVIFALSSEIARETQSRLNADDAVKEYLTLVRGTTPETFESDRPLRNKHGEPTPSRTTFRTLAHADQCSLIVARIHTGRHHQIRRHLNHLAHHVIGDTTHGKGRINQRFRDTYALPRMFLHATHLELRHPRTDTRFAIDDPLPADLRKVLDRLEIDVTPLDAID